MSRSLSVLIKTIETKPRSAGFEFNTRDRTWLLTGPASDIAPTRQGKYAYIGSGDARLCLLHKMDGRSRVGDLRGGFSAETVAEGATGTGHLDEAGMAFNWTADKSIEL